MLINLSNHPFSKWSQFQKDTAFSTYHEVEDMPFPHVDPGLDRRDIHGMAEEYCARILEIRPAAVHIMGEMTFTCALVQLLKESGILCIASTTVRVMHENADGTRTYDFRFIRFRAY